MAFRGAARSGVKHDTRCFRSVTRRSTGLGSRTHLAQHETSRNFALQTEFVLGSSASSMPLCAGFFECWNEAKGKVHVSLMRWHQGHGQLQALAKPWFCDAVLHCHAPQVLSCCSRSPNCQLVHRKPVEGPSCHVGAAEEQFCFLSRCCRWLASCSWTVLASVGENKLSTMLEPD